MFSPIELLWALMGLIVTIGATWLEVFVTNAPWAWGGVGLQFYSLGVSFQVGAVLLTSCLGGQNAGAMAQVAYLSLGLFLFQVFEMQVFTQGSGLSYLREPSFGYLLGFIPAAWVCGFLAFQWKPRLEHLTLSCLGGVAAIHLTGLVYLLAAYLFQWTGETSLSLGEAIVAFSLSQLPGQLVVACAVSLVAYLMRQLMFY
ncbi:MAG: biotin transporter BioY [Cyanobacteria bacterium J06648_16]